jgi:hypothetical protein
MMDKSTNWLLVIGYRLSVLSALLACVFYARADDASTLLNAPKLPPYQWFASTDPNHQNADYILLKPNEMRRVPLARGVLLRLWSTALEPDKIALDLDGISVSRIDVRNMFLTGGKAQLGTYANKAYVWYPKGSTGWNDLGNNAHLIVTNLSSKPNKWFYQVTVRSETELGEASHAMRIEQERMRHKAVLPPLDQVDWQKLDPAIKVAAEKGKKIFTFPSNVKTPYQLCVASGSARSQKGKPIPILNVTGEGAFVGLVLDIRPAPDAHRRTFAFLEGNETITDDDKKYEGTGTEDFFNSAWYFPDKPFSQPYHGLTQKSTSPPGVTAYRWMILDAMPFKKSFKFEFEHGNGNNSNDLEYRWVAFWYQKPSGKFEIKDELKGGASTPERAAGDSKEMLNFNPALLKVALAALAGGLFVMGWVWLRRARH